MRVCLVFCVVFLFAFAVAFLPVCLYCSCLAKPDHYSCLSPSLPYPPPPSLSLVRRLCISLSTLLSIVLALSPTLPLTSVSGLSVWLMLVRMSVCLSVSVFMSVCLYVCVYYMLVCLFVCMCVCTISSLAHAVCLSVCIMSVCMYVLSPVWLILVHNIETSYV